MSEESETIDVAQTYASTMDSVNLINTMYDEGLTVDEEDLATIQRNKCHLEIMLGKDFWTDAQDLEPVQSAFGRTE
jgi:L-rhamnose isomerase